MAEESKNIKVTAKSPSKVYTCELPADSTVSHLKDLLLPQTENATKEQLCVIYTGKILKDDETLSFHKIGDGHTVHLVIRNRPAAATPSAAATSTPAPQPSATAAPPRPAQTTPNPFGGGMPSNPSEILNNPDMMRQMMDNPIAQSIMNNPEFMRSIISSNPQFQQLIERNPEVGHMLNDPNIMRQTMEMIRNPNMFQEMMRNHDLAIRNLQGIPGGEAALERLYNDVQEPLLNSATGSDNPFASLRGEQQNSEPRVNRAGQENNEALPNPWAPRTNTQQQQQNNPRGGALGGDDLVGMMNSPGMQSMMQQMMQDPNISANLFSPQMMETMRNSVMNNPEMLEAVLGASPTVQNNPGMMDALRSRLPQMLETMSNPNVIRAMQNPRIAEAFRQIQEGYSIIRQEAPELLGALGDPLMGAAPGSRPAPTSGGNTTNSPNQADFLAQMMRNMGGLGSNAPRAPPANPEQEYASQLEQLQSMGFPNRSANIAALISAFGDLNAAVERLLNSP